MRMIFGSIQARKFLIELSKLTLSAHLFAFTLVILNSLASEPSDWLTQWIRLGNSLVWLVSDNPLATIFLVWAFGAALTSPHPTGSSILRRAARSPLTVAFVGIILVLWPSALSNAAIPGIFWLTIFVSYRLTWYWLPIMVKRIMVRKTLTQI